MMNVRFVAGFAPIVKDIDEARRFYGDVLSLPLVFEEGSDYTTAKLDGLKHFGLWTLQGAAESVFGRSEWPDDVPVPQGVIEFEVDDVAAAVEELRSKGADILQETRTEPWGQITARLLSPDGLLVGVTYTPSLREG